MLIYYIIYQNIPLVVEKHCFTLCKDQSKLSMAAIEKHGEKG